MTPEHVAQHMAGHTYTGSCARRDKIPDNVPLSPWDLSAYADVYYSHAIANSMSFCFHWHNRMSPGGYFFRDRGSRRLGPGADLCTLNW